jgi:methionine biosynthesis protein MetW
MTNCCPSYIGPRNDILALIPKQVQSVLDIGCSTGKLGQQLKQRKNIQVIGIEINQTMAEIAKSILDKVIIADVEKMLFDDYFSSDYFDCIIFADILEHLTDPWTVLMHATKFLSKTGLIIASIPNIKHYTTVIDLVFKGIWPYRERGLHDKTHLRFFTLKTITEMFNNCNLKITNIQRKYRIIERPHPYNNYSKYLALPILKDFLTFQYLVVAQK